MTLEFTIAPELLYERSCTGSALISIYCSKLVPYTYCSLQNTLTASTCPLNCYSKTSNDHIFMFHKISDLVRKLLYLNLLKPVMNTYSCFTKYKV